MRKFTYYFETLLEHAGFWQTMVWVLILSGLTIINALDHANLKARDEVQRARAEEIEENIDLLNGKLRNLQAQLDELRPKPRPAFWLGDKR